MVKVTVKWQKKKFEVDVDPEGPLDVLRAQLFDLSGVPVERQKILCKGRQLKEDSDLKKVKVNQKLMMMGTATELRNAPAKPVLFKEDLPEIHHEDSIPSGLQNLGNTCYMNSVVQCLRGIPEFKGSVQKYFRGNPPTGFETITVPQALGKLYEKLDTTTDAVPPFVFWNTLKRFYPMFAETTPQGHPKQHDADECYSNLLEYCRGEIKDEGKESEGNIVDDLFSGEMTTTLKCVDNPDEPEQTSTSKFIKLRCHISDNKISHCHSGIMDGLEQTVEKKAIGGDTNMNWSSSSRMSKLPPYLTVQFVRFFFFQSSQRKVKINRKIAFPVDTKLDVYDFCSSQLREKIGALRQKRLAEKDAAREAAQSGTSGAEADDAKSESDKSEVPKPVAVESSGDVDAMEVDAGVGAATEDATMDAVTTIDDAAMDISTCDDEQESGYYELVALVTHKGLAVDSGHYVGWVKQAKDDWLKFDDAKVTPCGAEDIKKLYGGGQWDTAYIAFYKKVTEF